MSRLGDWTPATVEERIDRLESLAQIQQLAQRYGVAVDSRNLDMLVGLFAEDVRVGRDAFGRAALRSWYAESLSRFGPSVHFVGNHQIDFDSADRATGIVYCRDEISRAELHRWDVGILQYWDEYERQGSTWYFRRRRFCRLYMCDALERPSTEVPASSTARMTTHRLPESYPSWSQFWDEAVAATAATPRVGATTIGASSPDVAV